MALEVIGAGLGRTGTLSLKAALEQLGFGPCHHMIEVFGHFEHRDFFRRAAEGEAVDWEQGLAGYCSTVDWPSCHFWRPLSERYPDAKVILSRRDPERWWESISETILKAIPMMMANAGPEEQAANLFIRRIIVEQTFGGDFSRENVVAAYERHNAAVCEAIPPERLLVFEPGDGWAPLCEFLGVPVPEEPYPRTNSREEFWAHNTPPELRASEAG